MLHRTTLLCNKQHFNINTSSFRNLGKWMQMQNNMLNLQPCAFRIILDKLYEWMYVKTCLTPIFVPFHTLSFISLHYSKVNLSYNVFKYCSFTISLELFHHDNASVNPIKTDSLMSVWKTWVSCIETWP